MGATKKLLCSFNLRHRLAIRVAYIHVCLCADVCGGGVDRGIPLPVSVAAMAVRNPPSRRSSGFCVLVVLVLLRADRCFGVEGRRRPVLARSQFLMSHNAARAVLGLPPLDWDMQLARYAQSYAKRRRRDCALVHSGGRYGENILWGSGLGWMPAQALAAWLEERRWYDCEANSCTPEQMCGTYTQVLWGSSRRLGCATINCSGGKGVFIICNYDPPGNYVGERPY